MKLICNISGLDSSLPEFPACHLSWQHPIFSLSGPQLLRITSQQWQRRKLSKSESRLLALALFNSTKLVFFDSAISASYQHLGQQESAINQAIPLLAEIIEFSLSCPSWPHSQLAEFPTIRIDASNNTDLKILVTACELWQACIADYHKGYYSAKQEKKHAEKMNFLAHLSAFSSRKPTRYIKALSHYVIDSIPYNAFNDRQEREHFRYIIEYSGLVHTLETRPIEPISKQEIESLLELITEHLSMDNLHIWKAFQALDKFLSSGCYSSYGVSMISDSLNAEQEQEQELKRAVIIAQLGARPQGFIAAMQYDAMVLKMLESGASHESL